MREKRPNKKATSLLYEIFNAAADGMCLIDKDFTIFAINSTLAKIFSLDKEDTIGKKCYEVLSGSACKTDHCCLVRILNGEKRIEFGRGRKNPNSFLGSYAEFKKAWIRAGRPQFFVWSSETGGRRLSRGSFHLYRRFEKLKSRRALKRLKR